MPSSCPFSISTNPKAAIHSSNQENFMFVSDLNNPEAKIQMRNEMLRLTETQKMIFKTTFPIIFSDAKRNGLVLFAGYFSEYPQYKNIWPQFRSLQDSALLASNELANHCSVYMCGLKEIVEVMDDEEKLIFFMAKIARSHVKWNINKYHITNMLIGVDHVLYRVFGKNVNPEVIEAYHTLYDVIGNMLDIQKKLVFTRRI